MYLQEIRDSASDSEARQWACHQAFQSEATALLIQAAHDAACDWAAIFRELLRKAQRLGMCRDAAVPVLAHVGRLEQLGLGGPGLSNTGQRHSRAWGELVRSLEGSPAMRVHSLVDAIEHAESPRIRKLYRAALAKLVATPVDPVCPSDLYSCVTTEPGSTQRIPVVGSPGWIVNIQSKSESECGWKVTARLEGTGSTPPLVSVEEKGEGGTSKFRLLEAEGDTTWSTRARGATIAFGAVGCKRPQVGSTTAACQAA